VWLDPADVQEGTEMDLDLQQALRDLHDSPVVRPDAVPVEPVIRRVRRGRAVRAGTVGVAALVVVLAVVVGVQEFAGRHRPPPPAATHGTEISPSPSVIEGAPAVVGMTLDGTLENLDPGNGAVVSVIARGLVSDAGLVMAPDRGSVYVGQVTSEQPDGVAAIVRVSLADGSVQHVAQGWDPAISPDGQWLVSVVVDPGANPDGSPTTRARALQVLDLASGEARTIRQVGPFDPEFVLAHPAWTPDGSSILVEVGQAPGIDTVGTREVVVVDAAATSLADARLLGPSAPDAAGGTVGWFNPTFTSDGRLAVSQVVLTSTPMARPAVPGVVRSEIALVDLSSGGVLSVVPTPPLFPMQLAARPDGDGFVLVSNEYPSEPNKLVLQVVHADGSVMALSHDAILSVAW
jgi:hypothetical protein